MALKTPLLFLLALSLFIAPGEAQSVDWSYRQSPQTLYRQPVYGYGYYYNNGYRSTGGPNMAYFYTPNYYVIPSRVPSPPVIYAPPVVYVAPAPGILQRQEKPPEPTIIHNNGPISAYNDYPRTIMTDSMDRETSVSPENEALSDED
jgi:hypothetical protein